jgi:hypothetical protein
MKLRDREGEREVRTFSPPCGLWVEELEMGLGLFVSTFVRENESIGNRHTGKRVSNL